MFLGVLCRRDALTLNGNDVVDTYITSRTADSNAKLREFGRIDGGIIDEQRGRDLGFVDHPHQIQIQWAVVLPYGCGGEGAVAIVLPLVAQMSRAP